MDIQINMFIIFSLPCPRSSRCPTDAIRVFAQENLTFKVPSCVAALEQDQATPTDPLELKFPGSCGLFVQPAVEKMIRQLSP